MANIPGFMSPRSDLTIRAVPPDKMEAVVNAVVDILGGRVEFSESAIYENVQEEPRKRKVIDIWLQCSYPGAHEPHNWSMSEVDVYSCPGRTEAVNG